MRIGACNPISVPDLRLQAFEKLKIDDKKFGHTAEARKRCRDELKVYLRAPEVPVLLPFLAQFPPYLAQFPPFLARSFLRLQYCLHSTARGLIAVTALDRVIPCRKPGDSVPKTERFRAYLPLSRVPLPSGLHEVDPCCTGACVYC